MKGLETIPSGLSLEEADERKKTFDNFVRDFKSTLRDRGVLHDFSLRKVVEEAKDGQVDFENHEQDVYNQIKDLLDNYQPFPTSNIDALPRPSKGIKKVA